MRRCCELLLRLERKRAAKQGGRKSPPPENETRIAQLTGWRLIDRSGALVLSMICSRYFEGGLYA